MEWKAMYHMLAERFDTQACLEKVTAIWKTDRWNSFDKNALTAQYCADAFERAGLSQVEILPLIADARTEYFYHSIRRAWDVTYATLCYEDGTCITDYAQLPCCLVTSCPPTPENGVKAEVIVPNRDENAPEKYAGKVLLVRESVASWIDFAKKNGAVGILSDVMHLIPGVRDTREELNDEVVWMGIPSVSDHGIFGFHLTPIQGKILREKLEKETVRIVTKISTRSYDGTLNTVSAALEGTNPDLPEVLIYGHLYEPGANDNAAGAAAILQLAETLASAVRDGSIRSPQRTIRFVLGYEYGGSMGYLASHADRPLLCGIIADMIGTEAGDRAVMGLYYDPVCNWSYADGALFALWKIAENFCGKSISNVSRPYATDTDNILADPSFHCPTVALCAAPALSYHTSMDRPDRIEPDTLTRNALIAGTYIWGMADADAKTCAFLADAIREQGSLKIADSVHPRQIRFWEDAIRFGLHSMNRILGNHLYPETDFDTEPVPPYAQEAGKRIPNRSKPGILTFNGTDIVKQFTGRWCGSPHIPVLWIDGKRNLWQIAYLSAMEQGKCMDDEIQKMFEFLCVYFDALEKHGFISWLK